MRQPTPAKCWRVWKVKKSKAGAFTSAKAKIDIILNEEGAEIRMERGTASWGEVIDALAGASAGAIVELAYPDKVGEMLALFCAHIVLIAKEKSKAIHPVERKEQDV